MDTNLLVTFAILLLLAVIGAGLLTGRRRAAQPARRVVEVDQSPRPSGFPAHDQRPEIVPLAAHEAQRFRMEWQALQARFAQSPRSAVAEADLLVRDVMMRRGYPTGDGGAGELPANDAALVAQFRSAHAIALRERKGEADADELLQAMVHYRALFDALLKVPRPAPQQRPEPLRGGFALGDRAMATANAMTKDRERRSER